MAKICSLERDAEAPRSNEQIENVKAKTDSGEKYLPQYAVEVLDTRNNLVAKITKTLYIRRKKLDK